ncbi:MAG: YjbH domain-containing protein, partial [Planktomarina sp.]
MRNLFLGMICIVIPGIAVSQTAAKYNLYGVPGLIEMPSAQMAPDGELALSFGQAGNSLRNTLSFQITPRLSGAFRYSRIRQWPNRAGTGVRSSLFDRSFDLRYQVLTEEKYRPAVVVGLQDFIGTGIYSGEYIVASKTFGSVVATGGIGWGRFGSYKGFDNPFGALSDEFGTRQIGFSGVGGELEAAKWFRGDAAVFGGLSWAVNDRLTFKAEYSSDAQVAETTRNHFVRSSPLNFGVDYRVGKRGQ